MLSKVVFKQAKGTSMGAFFSANHIFQLESIKKELGGKVWESILVK